MKKLFAYSLAGLLALSCSVSTPNNSSQSQGTGHGSSVKEDFSALAKKYNFAELEKEYKSFNTKALSNAYVQRMFNKFLTTGAEKPTQVIRQLEFARYLKDVKSDPGYFNSLKTIIAADYTIYTRMIGLSDIQAYKTANPATFGTFIQSVGFIVVSTFAGTPNVSGSTDGQGTNAQFSTPTGIAVDQTGNVYVADMGNNKIRKITSSGVVSTLAGTGSPGSADGDGTSATFSGPYGLTVDSATGDIYVADTGNNKIRKITSSGVVSTLAGTGSPGSENGDATSSTFNTPWGAVVYNGNLYVADRLSFKIRKIDLSTKIVSTYAGTGHNDYLDGPRTSAKFGPLLGIAVDSAGNFYVSDPGNLHTIRKIDALTGIVSTFFSGTTNLYLYAPIGLAVDSNDNLIVADKNNHRIRKITQSVDISTFAGDDSITSGYIDGSVTSARFASPYGVAVGSNGAVYVADAGNQVIRKIE